MRTRTSAQRPQPNVVLVRKTTRSPSRAKPIQTKTAASWCRPAGGGSGAGTLHRHRALATTRLQNLPRWPRGKSRRLRRNACVMHGPSQCRRRDTQLSAEAPSSGRNRCRSTGTATWHARRSRSPTSRALARADVLTVCQGPRLRSPRLFQPQPRRLAREPPLSPRKRQAGVNARSHHVAGPMAFWPRVGGGIAIPRIPL